MTITKRYSLNWRLNHLQQNEFEEAEERFLIMSAEPDVDDSKACKYIQKKYGRETAVKLWEKYGKKRQSIR